jgi:hypothetical protein
VPPFFTQPLDLGKLVGNIESDNVQSMDVTSLAALMTDKNSHVPVYDIDPTGSSKRSANSRSTIWSRDMMTNSRTNTQAAAATRTMRSTRGLAQCESPERPIF